MVLKMDTRAEPKGKNKDCCKSKATTVFNTLNKEEILIVQSIENTRTATTFISTTTQKRIIKYYEGKLEGIQYAQKILKSVFKLED